MKSQARRAEFKSVWGVSPRCINKKRTIKTVINAPEVAFSPEAPKCNEQEDNEIDDKLSSTEHMFGNNDKSGNENEGPLSKLPNPEIAVDGNGAGEG